VDFTLRGRSQRRHQLFHRGVALDEPGDAESRASEDFVFVLLCDSEGDDPDAIVGCSRSQFGRTHYHGVRKNDVWLGIAKLEEDLLRHVRSDLHFRLCCERSRQAFSVEANVAHDHDANCRRRCHPDFPYCCVQLRWR
jgi:hypothetical protein